MSDLCDGENNIGSHHHVQTERAGPNLLQVFLVVLALYQLPGPLQWVWWWWGCGVILSVYLEHFSPESFTELGKTETTPSSLLVKTKWSRLMLMRIIFSVSGVTRLVSRVALLLRLFDNSKLSLQHEI